MGRAEEEDAGRGGEDVPVVAEVRLLQGRAAPGVGLAGVDESLLDDEAAEAVAEEDDGSLALRTSGSVHDDGTTDDDTYADGTGQQLARMSSVLGDAAQQLGAALLQVDVRGIVVPLRRVLERQDACGREVSGQLASQPVVTAGFGGIVAHDGPGRASLAGQSMDGDDAARSAEQASGDTHSTAASPWKSGPSGREGTYSS
jgi:hypothetical protein